MTLKEKIAELRANPDKVDLIPQIEQALEALEASHSKLEERNQLLMDSNLKLLNSQPIVPPKPEDKPDEEPLPTMTEITERLARQLEGVKE